MRERLSWRGYETNVCEPDRYTLLNILSGINIHSNTPTSENGGVTFTVYRSPGGTGITLISNYTFGLTATQTDLAYYNTTQDLAAGDLIHVGVVYSGGGNNNTIGDISIQLDMF
jgi:hypothetical protein